MTQSWDILILVGKFWNLLGNFETHSWGILRLVERFVTLVGRLQDKLGDVRLITYHGSFLKAPSTTATIRA